MQISKNLRTQYEVPQHIDANIYNLVWYSAKSRRTFRIWKQAAVLGVFAVCGFGGYRYYDYYETNTQYNQTIASIDNTLTDFQEVSLQW